MDGVTNKQDISERSSPEKTPGSDSMDKQIVLGSVVVSLFAVLGEPWQTASGVRMRHDKVGPKSCMTTGVERENATTSSKVAVEGRWDVQAAGKRLSRLSPVRS